MPRPQRLASAHWTVGRVVEAGQKLFGLWAYRDLICIYQNIIITFGKEYVKIDNKV